MAEYVAESHIEEAGRREQTVVVILDYTCHTRVVAAIWRIWESKFNRVIDCPEVRSLIGIR